jgi:hypothetical protein
MQDRIGGIMCWSMYLFTDNHIEEREWNNDNRQIFIRNIKQKKMGNDSGVLNWGDHNINIYYIGSSQGCGCGWKLPCNYSIGISDDDEKEEIEETAKDRNDLYKLLKSDNYINSCIIICWEGDQGETIKGTEKIKVDDIKNMNYDFDELTKYILE